MNVPRHFARVTASALLLPLLVLASGCATIIEGAIDAAVYDTPEKRRARAELDGEPYYGPESSKKEGRLRKSD